MKILDDDIITANKENYLMLLESIDREGAKIKELMEFLNSSDFFVAPASSVYHAAYKGGLCEHSLNVYSNLVNLVKMSGIEIDENSVKIAALCHDFAKINYYKLDYMNKKVYCESGSKHDNAGRFDWVSVPCYKKCDNEMIIYGNHEQNSEFITRCYIPLSMEESSSILNHHGGMGNDSSKMPICSIYEKYSLACLLHLADMMASYVQESRNE